MFWLTIIFIGFYTPGSAHLPVGRTMQNSRKKWSKGEWKSSNTLIHNLADIVSKGGNYLLNIGPDAQGQVPAECVKRLNEVGKWMQANGESIYGTRRSPFTQTFSWGRVTTRPGKLYLHVFAWPKEGTIVLPVSNQADKMYLLTDPKTTLTTKAADTGLTITLPEKMPDADDSVLVMEYAGDLKPISPALKQQADGTILLTAQDALLEGSIQLENIDGKPNIGFWTDAQSKLTWRVDVTKPGVFTVELEYACQPDSGGSVVDLVSGKQKVTGAIAATKGWGDFITVNLGPFTIDKAGRQDLVLHAVNKPNLAVMNLRSIKLKPDGANELLRLYDEMDAGDRERLLAIARTLYSLAK